MSEPPMLPEIIASAKAVRDQLFETIALEANYHGWDVHVYEAPCMFAAQGDWLYLRPVGIAYVESTRPRPTMVVHP